MRVCSIEDCEGKVTGKGYCQKHYTRFKRHGDPYKVSPRTISEKCLKRATEAKTQHGHNKKHHPSPTYISWQCCKARCKYTSRHNYKDYGGRGIRVCERWDKSFVNFLADMGERPEGTTLDRIDPNGNYEPGNCRWATAEEQARNTQKSERLLTYKF